MVGQVEPWAADLGAYALIVAGIIGAAFALGKVRPIRRISHGVTTMAGRAWRAAISDPLAKWFRANVRHEVDEVLERRLKPIEAELRPNGGDSLRDRVDRLEEQHGELRRGVERIGDQVGVVGIFDPALPERRRVG